MPDALPSGSLLPVFGRGAPQPRPPGWRGFEEVADGDGLHTPPPQLGDERGEIFPRRFLALSRHVHEHEAAAELWETQEASHDGRRILIET